ncbi:hypothetical protein H6P81_007231 [Aristolochia fimbriata]|uniref:Methyltransferase type 11 domain-containing protein n=1 Tax=Aristolochia fimbriata TaxID=158543 RepID=A0AAV7EZR5_ARIFI|nr:hypothetical protein H6P81_007231 [Aristolochia fimbriata]
MEGRSLKSVFNRISLASITLATFIFFLLYNYPQRPCFSYLAAQLQSAPLPRYPKTSCEANRRDVLSPEKRSKKLFSSKDSKKRISALRDFFKPVSDLGLVGNSSRVLCVSAAAGHEVVAFLEMGVGDVTGVEVVDTPPIVSRADPHNLPYFDGIFDLAYTAHIAEAMFPDRFASEMERTVRPGGAIVLALEGSWSEREVKQFNEGLFEKSRIVEARNVTLTGSEVTMIILRNGVPRSQA